jgi:hypothetical protein
MGRMALLVLVLTALAAVALVWIARSGLWRRRRVAIVRGALLAAFLLLTRRVGLGELAVLSVLVLLPAVLVGGRGAPRG